MHIGFIINVSAEQPLYDHLMITYLNVLIIIMICWTCLFLTRYDNGAVQQQQYGVRTSKELLLTRPLQEVYPPLLHVRWPHPHHRRPLSGKTLEVVKKWRHKFRGFSRGREHEMNIIVNVYNSFIQNYSYEGLSKT